MRALLLFVLLAGSVCPALFAPSVAFAADSLVLQPWTIEHMRADLAAVRDENPDKYSDTCKVMDYINTVQRRQPAYISYFVSRRIVDHVYRPEFVYDTVDRRVAFLSLIMGVVQVESGYNPLAVSPKNARGLMQVHYPTWKGYFSSQREVHNMEKNLLMGTAILYRYYIENGYDIRKALHRYLGASDDTYVRNVLASAVRFKMRYYQNRLT
jgi:hypothetical protein